MDIFYGWIRDVLHQCEYDPAMQKVLEAKTLKYGLTNSKIIEKVYALPKDADANRVLDTARAEEQAQTHIREVEKIRRDHNLGETKSAEELRQQKKPPSKKSKASSGGRTKNQYDCTRCGRKHGPKQCPAYGKECSKCKRVTLLSSAVTRETLIPPASDLASRTKHPDPRRSFTKQLQTQKVAKQTSKSTTLTRSQYKMTLWKQRLKKSSLPRRMSPRSIWTRTNHLMYCTPLFNSNYRMGVQRSSKGKVDTGAQVNLMNYMTFREIFGNGAEKILHDSQVKLTGYGGKRFKNHGKFRIDCVRHNDVVGQRVEFFVSDYGSNLFSLKFTRAMKIIKIMCEVEKDCKDCHGPYDVSEVRDSAEEEKEATPAPGQDSAKPKYSLKVRKPIEIRDTAQVIKDASDVFEGIGKLKGYQYQI